MKENTLYMLIVNDLEMNRTMLKRIFLEDYLIIEAEDGNQAMDILHKYPVDIVLLDIIMPKMDGFEVIRQMKDDTILTTIPIVVTTAELQKGENQALLLGADDFILAPFDHRIVKKRVQNIVSKYILEKKAFESKIAQVNHLAAIKSEFLARMSHEIRTPINSILGLTQLSVPYINSPQKMKDTLNKIEFQSMQLLGLVNDILDMSSLEKNKLQIKQEPFDFKDLILSMTEIYSVECQKKNIEFDLFLDGVTHEKLIGDKMRVKQILDNLLTNAYKFTEKGSIVITVSQLHIIDHQVRIRFSIADSGCGISNEIQEKIWQPFEHGDNTTKDYRGTGLGLAIVKNLVDLMDGSISFSTEQNRGTTFVIELPFEVTQSGEEDGKRDFHKIRALVVDDDEQTRVYASAVLSRIGVSFEVADCAKTAFEMLKIAYDVGSGYDLCFIDWKMKDCNGCELTRKIRQLFDEDTVIIVISAYDLSQIQDEAIAAGANNLIAKPLFQSTIFDLLMNITNGIYKRNIDQQLGYDFSDKKVLIAEDNEINAEVIIGYMKMVGAKTKLARNGQIVVDEFLNSEESEYDAILMDIRMPIMDGITATKKIRESKHKNAQTIPIIAVTAEAFASKIEEIIENGMDAHVAKPIDAQVLYQMLEEFWKER